MAGRLALKWQFAASGEPFAWTFFTVLPVFITVAPPVRASCLGHSMMRANCSAPRQSTCSAAEFAANPPIRACERSSAAFMPPHAVRLTLRSTQGISWRLPSHATRSLRACYLALRCTVIGIIWLSRQLGQMPEEKAFFHDPPLALILVQQT